jgi:hypothetical protein
MEHRKGRVSNYHIYLKLTRGYVVKQAYLRQDKCVEIEKRLDTALKMCGFDKKLPYTLDSGTVIYPMIMCKYPKKYDAELVVSAFGFDGNRGFRPGDLLEAVRSYFGEITKDIKVFSEMEQAQILGNAGGSE